MDAAGARAWHHDHGGGHYLPWKQHHINLIDTPGHVDFTIEVERSLRVLDGAVTIFAAVEGVQPQSESVWRQADRYHVPRLAFINKMDRLGADYQRVLQEMQDKLGARPLLLQLPLGTEERFRGIIDLVDMQSVVWHAEGLGMVPEIGAIPEDMPPQTAFPEAFALWDPSEPSCIPSCGVCLSPGGRAAPHAAWLRGAPAGLPRRAGCARAHPTGGVSAGGWC